MTTKTSPVTSFETVPFEKVRAAADAQMTDADRLEYAAGLVEAKAQEVTAIAVYQARIQAGLTQTELAHLAGTTQAVISRIENGQVPTVALLIRIADALGKELRLAFV